MCCQSYALELVTLTHKGINLKLEKATYYWLICLLFHLDIFTYTISENCIYIYIWEKYWSQSYANLQWHWIKYLLHVFLLLGQVDL